MFSDRDRAERIQPHNTTYHTHIAIVNPQLEYSKQDPNIVHTCVLYVLSEVRILTPRNLSGVIGGIAIANQQTNYTCAVH